MSSPCVLTPSPAVPVTPGTAFEFLFGDDMSRTPEEMALYDRFGPDYEEAVMGLSPASQLALKAKIAYEASIQ